MASQPVILLTPVKFMINGTWSLTSVREICAFKAPVLGLNFVLLHTVPPNSARFVRSQTAASDGQ